MEKEKIVGILGGMGPEATIEFMYRLIKKNPASSDNEHIRCIVDQNAKVPSRVRSISGEGPLAGPVLADMAKRLDQHGADLLCMPCNTAHYYLPDIKEVTSLPFVDMLACTVEHILKTKPTEKKVGVLATYGTINTGLYKNRLKDHGLEEIKPNPALQTRVDNVIDAVKAGNTSQAIVDEFKDIVSIMRDNGVNILIAACTELSVICPTDDPLIIDALDCLADRIILLVKGSN